jgi:toxin FitB
MYLLDTNVVSELRKPRPHGAVVAWVEAQEEAHLFVSAVTIGEIQAGIELTRGRDPDKAKALERWLEQVSGSYNVLSMGGKTFRIWARLMFQKSDALYEDAMIAAIALQHNLIVATRNGNDFKPLKVATVNPFK